MTESIENVAITFDHVVRDTPGALGISIDRKVFWIPQSQIVDSSLEDTELIIPRWLAEKKGLDLYAEEVDA